jgi:hypothetical protein
MSKPGVRLTYDFVRQYFADHGCELLETAYKNARTKLRYRCECGKESSIVFDSFRRGNRCQSCGNRKTVQKLIYTQEEVAKQFKDGGCELLGQYTRSRAKVEYRCSCGQKDKISLNNFQKGHRCWACGLHKRSGENHYEWQKDRELIAERLKFRQRSYKLVKMTLKKIGGKKTTKTSKLLGYDHEQLQKHITTHPNYNLLKGTRWHIDHIFPIGAFHEYGISDVSIINALDNLRPLGYKENIRKGDKYERSEFELYLKEKGIIWNSM